MLDDVSAADAALWLGIYSTVVSTAVALVSLYGQIFLRVRVVARDAFLVPKEGGGSLVVVGEDALDEMGIPRDVAQPILTIGVQNRGRQRVQIQTVSRRAGLRHDVFHDIIEGLPIEIEAGHAIHLTHGAEGGHVHGEIPLRRFFVLDGAGRVHPLRERWGQRLEDFFYRRAILWFRRRKAKRGDA